MEGKSNLITLVPLNIFFSSYIVDLSGVLSLEISEFSFNIEKFLAARSDAGFKGLFICVWFPTGNSFFICTFAYAFSLLHNGQFTTASYFYAFLIDQLN